MNGKHRLEKCENMFLRSVEVKILRARALLNHHFDNYVPTFFLSIYFPLKICGFKFQQQILNDFYDTENRK